MKLWVTTRALRRIMKSKLSFHAKCQTSCKLSLVSIWSQTIADDRGSRIADRKRSQRMLFPYNRKRSQRRVLSHISVLGNYENYGLWAILWLELISEKLNSYWAEYRRDRDSYASFKQKIKKILWLELISEKLNSYWAEYRRDRDGSIFVRYSI